MRTLNLPAGRVGLVAGSLAAAGLVVAMLSGAAASSSGSSTTCGSSGKCYAVAVSPDANSLASPGDAGASVPFTFTITNEASTQTLGSIQITAPTGFAITGASSPEPATEVSFSASTATFLYLNLSPGQPPVQVTVTATVPCTSASTTPLGWGTEAKQSNQFNGSGNDFQLDTANSDLSAAVTGQCTLSFAAEPASTQVGSPITAGFDSSTTNGYVQVDVLAASGGLATTSAAKVTLAAADSSLPPLSGTTSVSAQAGVATFPNLSVGSVASAYRIEATSPGIGAVYSSYFEIWGSLLPCSTVPCSASASTKTTTGTVTATSVTSGSSATTATSPSYDLGSGLGGVSFSCGTNYTETSAPLSFDVLSGSGVPQSGAAFSGTLEISKQAVEASGHLGAASWQLCYASTQDFAGETGTVVIGDTTYHTGLLPGCSNTQGAPCLQAANKDNAGDVLLTFLALGDPRLWG